MKSANDEIQMIKKTMNKTHTTKQQLTNNGFHNTTKHPLLVSLSIDVFRLSMNPSRFLFPYAR